VNYDAALERRPGSETTWRSQGDTLAKLNRPAEAREAYGRAAALAEAVLETDPGDARTRGFLAVCRAKLGDARRALDLAAEALAISPRDHQVIYRSAVVHALTGRVDDARVLLQRAIDAGYSPAAAAEDDDLAGLRPLPDLKPRP
jgi:Flp pilus assembly protein TadD